MTAFDIAETDMIDGNPGNLDEGVMREKEAAQGKREAAPPPGAKPPDKAPPVKAQAKDSPPALDEAAEELKRRIWEIIKVPACPAEGVCCPVQGRGPGGPAAYS
jgi:hypothetical protein